MIDTAWQGTVDFYELVFGTWLAYIFLVLMWERVLKTPLPEWKFYQSKDGKQTKTFDALEWLAAMCSHVPNRGEQIVRYYGYYRDVSR